MSSNSVLNTFQCPRCGGRLEHERGQKTITCKYCGNSVIVPKELRTEEVPAAQRGQQVVVNIPSSGMYSSTAPEIYGTGSPETRRWIGCLVVLILGCVAVSVIGPILLSAGIPLAIMGAIGLSPDILGIDLSSFGISDSANPGGGFASITMSFGGEGVGPGLFDDVRYATVDGQGMIYTGDYQDGRVQVFDPTGAFVTQWTVPDTTPLRALTAARNGTVYAVYGGDIHYYEGSSGKLLDTVKYSEGIGFDDLALTLDGGFVTAWYRNRDDIVIFDADGAVTSTIPAAISTASGDSELDTRVAVDGLGNIYALGRFNNAVFKFSPQGRFLTRFGSDGDQLGQFRAPLAIAVDGQGRIFVADFKGIQVFDGDGLYLGLIDVNGPAYGISFDPEGNLWVATGQQVVKYHINQ
jgi:DNA-binding beta-propeller fold protein YncE/DNA-directed RNA polymerase subunit RPC12/RpoP